MAALLQMCDKLFVLFMRHNQHFDISQFNLIKYSLFISIVTDSADELKRGAQLSEVSPFLCCSIKHYYTTNTQVIKKRLHL